MQLTPLFRASNFGRHYLEVYASQVLGLRFEQSESMLRGLIAEDIVRNGEDEVKAKYKIIPAKLEGTGFKRWAEYDAAHNIDRSAGNVVAKDTWDDACAAAACLVRGMDKIGFDPKAASYQEQFVLRLGEPKELFGRDSNSVSCTTDFIHNGVCIDTKVMSNPLEVNGSFEETYAWQLSIQKEASKSKEAFILAAIKVNGRWMCQKFAPALSSQYLLKLRADSLSSGMKETAALND